MEWEELREKVVGLKAGQDWSGIAALARGVSPKQAPISSQLALLYDLIGVALMLSPSKDEDLRLAKEWLLVAASCPVPDEDLCRVAVSLAAVYRMMGDEENAMNSLAGWNHRNAGKFAWHVTQHRGVYYLRTGRPRRAVKLLSLALKLSEGKPMMSQYTFVGLQEALIECGELETVERNLKSHPLIPSLEGTRHALLCVVAERKGDFAETIRHGAAALWKLRQDSNGDASQASLYLQRVYAALMRAYAKKGNAQLVEFLRQSVQGEVALSKAIKAALLDGSPS